MQTYPVLGPAQALGMQDDFSLSSFRTMVRNELKLLIREISLYISYGTLQDYIFYLNTELFHKDIDWVTNLARSSASDIDHLLVFLTERFEGNKASFYWILSLFYYSALFLKKKGKEDIINRFASNLNQTFTRFNFVYRMEQSSCLFIPVTNEAELASVSEAALSPYPKVQEPFKLAIAALADNKEHNRGAVITQAYLAVENLMRELTGKEDSQKILPTLKAKLKENYPPIEPHLSSIIGQLHGFRSKQAAHQEDFDSQLTVDEAKFMLVTCSSVINYLTAKLGVTS